jgi:hypothetical protein
MVEPRAERVSQWNRQGGLMEGFEVKTVEDEKIGHVVGESGDFLIVEHGHLRKAKHALPREFADVDASARVVLMTVPKEVFSDSPKVENGSLDEQAVREHYGLSFATEPDPPGTAEADAVRAGVETGPQERSRIRDEMDRAESGLPDESPGLLGDRVSSVDEREQQQER